MMHLTELADRINNFDSYYEMSDSDRTWTNGNRENMAIKRELSEMTIEERVELRKLITKDAEIVTRYWSDYLDNLPEPTPTATEANATRSKVFVNAWHYFKKGIYLTFSEALKAAWAAHKVVKALQSGIVSMCYRKATGELREARGTLNLERTATTKDGKGNAPDVIKYYDLGREAWRSFRVERLISIAA